MSQIKVLEDLVSGENSLPGLKAASCHIIK